MGTTALILGVPAPALSVLNAANNVPSNGTPFAVPSSAGVDITWDVVQSGTALATVEVDLQGSLDAAFTNPFQIDKQAAVAAGYAKALTGIQFPFLRAVLVAATGGDATSKVVARIYAKKRGADV